MKYLSEEELKGFENYEYTCKDTSPLSNYVMHPFWDQAVKLVPRGVAPNVLTMSGFVLTLVNVGLLSYYDFAFYASSDLHPEAPPVPPWVWLVCAVNQFLAHTLDGIDGKHARRTGSSGPLGELFDHGLDSWATLFMPVCLYSVFGRAEMSCNTWRFLLVLCNIHFCFILSHWEKYNTGILYLPWGYDISQMILLGSFVLTYLYSYRLWKFTILGWGAGECLELTLHAGSFFMTIPMCLYNIHRHDTSPHQAKEDDQRRSPRKLGLPPEHGLLPEKLPATIEARPVKMSEAQLPTTVVLQQPREPPKFRGTPCDDPEDWLEQFEHVVAINKWNDEAKL
ncbi:hypothetical protein HPB51_026036 [Rhipicephalus microplus]|uniref:Uncharacterized protein n=1 Tax=Rhipicephalus microplus TaxID=6941 RepID=A0A9J6EE53_RHIMP|nr:hypothetical protein HPB51_026036 [Rhipicephalus microplus]